MITLAMPVAGLPSEDWSPAQIAEMPCEPVQADRASRSESCPSVAAHVAS